MACFEVRLDARDFNSGGNQTVGQLLYPGTGTKVYAIWSGVKSAPPPYSNREVNINSFDWSTKLAGTVVQIQDDVGVNCTQLQSCILNDGTMIAVYGTNNPRAKESTDSGATWGSSKDLDGVYGAGVVETLGIVTDGVNVWAFVGNTSGGADSRDIFAIKRTGPGTWAAPVKVDDGAGSSGPGHFLDSAAICGVRNAAMKDANTGLIIMDYIPVGAGQQLSVVALRTTNGWSGLGTRVTLKTYATPKNRVPSLMVGTDGRVRASWSDETIRAGSGLNTPYLAYSDDWGATWTLLGTPTATLTSAGVFSWDPTFDRAQWLGANNTWFLGTFDDTSGTIHRLYKGGDVITGWTEVDCTGLPFAIATASGGDGYIAGGNWFRLFIRANLAHSEVAILFTEAVDTGGGGGPPLIESSPFGQDSANIYLRNELRVNRGWSAHDLPVSAWMHWFEGDYTSQRRKPVLCAANPIMDPRMQDPAVIPAIWKVDDENRYTIEAFVANGDGTYAQAGYPVEFEWRSSEMDLTGDFTANVVRAVILKYRRPSAPFDVEIWIDSKIAQVYTLQPSWPEPAQRFIPVSAFSNTGNRVQLRVKDRSEFNLIIESWAPVYIPKRLRGAN